MYATFRTYTKMQSNYEHNPIACCDPYETPYESAIFIYLAGIFNIVRLSLCYNIYSGFRSTFFNFLKIISITLKKHLVNIIMHPDQLEPISHLFLL